VHIFQTAIQPSSVTVPYTFPSQSESYETYAQKFARLSKQWKAETGFISNMSRRVMHQAYQQIILMKEKAIPFMLNDFQNGIYTDWFHALSHITHENPVAPEDAGNVEAMAQSWIRWGKENGYLKA
jgi:hypothetical protein